MRAAGATLPPGIFREMLIMLEFLQNNWGSLMVGAIILAVVVRIVINLVRDRIAG